MDIDFCKYQGTGNDFILIDNRDNDISLHTQQVAQLCHRRYGIGADGLMLLENAAGYDFKMVYYNADGRESSMCGNGGRCITAFAKQLNIIGTHASFLAIDGPHQAVINNDGDIALQMKDVGDIQFGNGCTVLDTGSPHYITWVGDTESVDVYNRGKAIRNLEAYAPGGINVNFVQQKQGMLYMRTYERGVEDETLSCGTGAVAAAIANTCAATGSFTNHIQTQGGMLKISFEKNTASSAVNVWLSGPAKLVFAGRAALPV